MLATARVLARGFIGAPGGGQHRTLPQFKSNEPCQSSSNLIYRVHNLLRRIGADNTGLRPSWENVVPTLFTRKIIFTPIITLLYFNLIRDTSSIYPLQLRLLESMVALSSIETEQFPLKRRSLANLLASVSPVKDLRVNRGGNKAVHDSNLQAGVSPFKVRHSTL